MGLRRWPRCFPACLAVPIMMTMAVVNVVVVVGLSITGQYRHSKQLPLAGGKPVAVARDLRQWHWQRLAPSGPNGNGGPTAHSISLPHRPSRRPSQRQCGGQCRCLCPCQAQRDAGLTPMDYALLMSPGRAAAVAAAVAVAAVAAATASARPRAMVVGRGGGALVTGRVRVQACVRVTERVRAQARVRVRGRVRAQACVRVTGRVRAQACV